MEISDNPVIKLAVFYSKIANSEKYYQEFKSAVLENDNRIIEETVVYKLLLIMLGEESKCFKRTIRKDKVFYRARICTEKDPSYFSVHGETISGLDKYMSKEPPLKVSTEGRNNIQGASYLYLSNDVYTACAEVRPLRGDYVSVAKFKSQKALRIYDLSKNEDVSCFSDFEEEHQCNVARLITLIMRAFYSPVKNSCNGYQVSQYISDLIRKHGYDGLCHKSFISDGSVTTLFNCSEDHIQFCDSELFFIEFTSVHARKLNDGTSLDIPTPEKTWNMDSMKREMVFKIKQRAAITKKENENDG